MWQGSLLRNFPLNHDIDIVPTINSLTETCLLYFFQMNIPYQWHPKIVDTQILKIGNIFIIAIPGEITTMAGR